MKGSCGNFTITNAIKSVERQMSLKCSLFSNLDKRRAFYPKLRDNFTPIRHSALVRTEFITKD